MDPGCFFGYPVKLETLRRVLEWRIEIDHNWSLKPGIHGRGFKQMLPTDIWSEFASTYVSLDVEKSWAALFRLIALFRRVVNEVGAALGYTYPQSLDDWVSAYLDAVRKLPHGVELTPADDSQAQGNTR